MALDAQGRTYVGDEVVDAPTFAARVAEAAKRNPQTEVQLRADQSVPYGRVAELIGTVQKAGLNRVGFVTEAPPAAAAGAAPAAPNAAPTGAPPSPATPPAPR